jgi:hypothetical protein
VFGFATLAAIPDHTLTLQTKPKTCKLLLFQTRLEKAANKLQIAKFFSKEAVGLWARAAECHANDG